VTEGIRTAESGRWDPEQYLRYADERARPFAELAARIRTDAPRVVVDLGCGPGGLTASLADRWPDALVIGVDSSAEMIAEAADRAVPGRLEFRCADVRDYTPDGPVDVVLSNALFQWVPRHIELLPRLASWLAPAGTVALQVPSNFDEPSHTIVRDLRRSPTWRARLDDDADRGAAVETPEVYLAALAGAGLEADVWATTYLHVLTGPDPVLEWIKGTALRPVLTALADDPAAIAAFLDECGSALRAAYPELAFGTVFPFRRNFADGRAKMSA
jgi:trans-aconitate 2-methyltransferase